MNEPKRRTGRPTTAAKAGQKATLGIRATADLKGRLLSEANRNARSLSQESELRLERSFERQDVAIEILEATYGRQLTGILMALGRTMKAAGGAAAFNETRTMDAVSNWLESPYAFDQAAIAATTIIEAFRPPGEVTNPKPQRVIRGGQPIDPEDGTLTIIHDAMANPGRGFAASTLGAIADPNDGATAEMKEWAQKVHNMLGPLAENWS